ncbi:MAG: hypothetical protein HYR51_05920 [Candidatus Rokubacteria bacterium]|nr:hypothetical protein [Candidatus Rokubacteria bacterium]
MARLALALLLATAAIAAGDEGIAPSVGAPTGGHAALVGLLDMPILYGYAEMPSDDPKPKPRPERIDVHAQPSARSAVVATIDTRGIAARGAHHCLWRGAMPGMAPEQAPKLPRCPHWESGYEIPALVVFETRRGGWYRVAVDRGATRFGWLESGETFHALESLVASDDHLTFLTARWPRTLHDRAGGGTTTHVAKHRPPEGQSGETTPYRALRHTRVAGELWIEVEVLDQVCAANDPRVIGKGWIPARAPGALLVWYHSRGC